MGESYDGGSGTDRIELFSGSGSTVDLTLGTLSNIETFLGSTFNDDVTLSVAQYFDFDNIDYGAGTDSQTIDVSGVNDVTAETTPTVTNLESSTLLFSAGVDDLTITGEQLDSLTTGTTSLDALGGADVLRITTTSNNLNTFGSVDADLEGLETIDASGATAAVDINVNGQIEGFTIDGGGFNDTLVGGSAADDINGGAGDDLITGLEGADILTGGAGDDTIFGGDDNDTLVGGDGDDTLYGATIIGESGVESVLQNNASTWFTVCLLYTSPSPRDRQKSRMPSSA